MEVPFPYGTTSETLVQPAISTSTSSHRIVSLPDTVPSIARSNCSGCSKVLGTKTESACERPCLFLARRALQGKADLAVAVRCQGERVACGLGLPRGLVEPDAEPALRGDGAAEEARGELLRHGAPRILHSQRDFAVELERDDDAHRGVGLALGEGVAHQVVADALEERARQPHSGAAAGEVEVHAFGPVLAHQALPPGRRRALR